MSKKQVDIWFSINRNGFLNLSIDEPIRNTLTGKWDIKYPFVNAHVYTEIQSLIEKTPFNWNNEPEFLTIQYDE